MSEYNIIISPRLKGQRIDYALTQMLPQLSRNKIINTIKNADATINNNTFKPKYKVLGNEIINFKYSKNTKTNWQKSKIKLDIVFEDDDILVINKPSGLVVHPGNANSDNTLANGLLYYNKQFANVDRAGIVHRLDKDTTGLLVVAKNYNAQRQLTTQLQQKTMQREYCALCYGHIIAGGTINKAISKCHKNPLKQMINDNGKFAITHYRIIEKFNDFTFLRVLLETGRTHQIRVHMQYLGHSLVGDNLYGNGLRLPKKINQQLRAALINFNRQALHAKKLEFIHPQNHRKLSFSQKMPDDMAELLALIQKTK